MSQDRTRSSLIRQLRGLGLDRFEITRKGPEHSGTEVWTPDEILKNLPKLKRWNGSGVDLYVRGLRDVDHDLIFIDDLDRFTIERMKSAGHGPAVFIETSPGNCQAWIRLGRPVPADVRIEVARILAAEYGGDMGAVGAHQAGRLVGFTNRKPKHKTHLGFPFVLLLNAPGKPAPASSSLIIDGKIEAAKAAVEAPKRREKMRNRPLGSIDERIVRAWEKSHEKSSDLSGTDWSNTNKCLAAGMKPSDLIAILLHVSDRKKDRAEGYARTTVEKAIKHQAEKKTNTPSPE